jgi:hypothetical protein
VEIYYPFNQVKGLILSVFPDYRGKKDVVVEVVPCLTQFNLNTTWSGGSCSSYAVVSRENFQVAQVKKDLGNMFLKQPSGQFILANGFLLFKRSILQGKHMPIRVYVTEDDIKLLPPSESSLVELSNSQALVLFTYRHFKAGYAGESRLQQCNSLYYPSYDNPKKFTQADWDQVVTELKYLGYLRGNTRISISTEGKNALSQFEEKMGKIDYHAKELFTNRS